MMRFFGKSFQDVSTTTPQEEVRIHSGEPKASRRISLQWEYFFLGILLTALAVQCLMFASTAGQTTDETFFSASGYPMVRYNNYQFLGEHPPLALQLGALPLLFVQPKYPIEAPLYVPGTDRLDLSRNGAFFLYKLGNNAQFILFLQRIPIVLLTLLLGAGLFFFSRDLWGKGGAFISLCLFSFCPNMIAHGSLYTTDMSLTCFYFFSIFALKRFFDKPSEKRAVVLGLMCGLALMSKISSFILLPVISCLFLVFYLSRAQGALLPEPSRGYEKWIIGISLFLLVNAIGEKQAMLLFGPCCLFAFYLGARDLPRVRDSRIFRNLLRALVTGGAVLCVAYAWRLKKKYGVGTASFLVFGNLIFFAVAAMFAKLSTADARMRFLKFFLSVWVLAGLVIVLGYTDIAYKFYRFIGFGNYMKPFGIVMSHSVDGHGACLEGSFITCDWRYFPGVMAVKTPLLTLGLALIGAIGLLFSNQGLRVKSILLVPLVFFFGAAMISKIHIGLRHILPVYPFLFLIAGYAGTLVAGIKPAVFKKASVVVLALLLILSAARTVVAGSDPLAYFNEWIGGPEQGARLVADSNLNWGQDNKRLAEFVLAKRIPMITIVSETGNADVYDYYKIRWKSADANELIRPAPGVYALGIRYYTAQRNDPRSWFYGKQPTDRVGKTFYIFEVKPGEGKP